MKCKWLFRNPLFIWGSLVVTVSVVGMLMLFCFSNKDSKESTTPEYSAPKDAPLLCEGDIYTIDYADGNVQIIFKNISVTKLSDEESNLVFTLCIRNNSNERFFISNAHWKLLDADKVEIEESGVYDSGYFVPSTFFFTTVDPNVGKNENVGYVVNEGTYYLSIYGKIIAMLHFK